MINILFVCFRFAPDNSIASIRTTKFAKYLNKTGKYNVDVLKLHANKGIEDELLKRDLCHVSHIYDAPYAEKPIRDYSHECSNTFFGRLKRRFLTLTEYFGQFHNNKKNLSAIKKFIKKEVDLSRYDVMFSSSGPFITHKTANYIKRKAPKIVWIADYRDPEPNTLASNGIVRGWARFLDRSATKSAEHITGASVSCYKSMGIYRDDKCTELLNGFDRDDVAGLPSSANDCFTLTYTGTLHDKKSNLSPIFKAIKELTDEGIVKRQKIRLCYAGRMQKEFDRTAERFGLSDCVESVGFIDRMSSIKLQKKSDILLLASFNTGLQTNIITGKFYEYLMNDTPIICTVSGEIANSRLKQMINELNCGFCFEEADEEKDFVKLKEYIRMQYEYYIKNGTAKNDTIKELTEKYSYINVANQLDGIICGLLMKEKVDGNEA